MNYTRYIRTNYFKVNDPDLFRIFISKVKGEENEVEVWERHNDDGSTRFGFGCYGDILGYVPDGTENLKNSRDYESVYERFLEGLQWHISKDDAVLLFEAGHEGLRYLQGLVTIITSSNVETIDIRTEAIKRTRQILDKPDYETDTAY